MRGLKFRRYLHLRYTLRRRTSHEVRGLKSRVLSYVDRRWPSHLTRGAWIEIIDHDLNPAFVTCRTSHEVRGLKLQLHHHRQECPDASHLTRGAWIEIFRTVVRFYSFPCRTSHEVRGLKYSDCPQDHLPRRRTSHEVRGLKSFRKLA